MLSDWRELVVFYEDLAKGPALPEYRYNGMVEFLKMLLTHRSLKGIECFASHDLLCVSLYKTHDERKDQPYVTIEVAETDRLALEFVQSTEEPGGVLRASKAEVICPLKDSLKYFDEMIGMLKESKKRQNG